MLKDSLAKFFKVDSLVSNITGYVETRIELLKIEAKEELSKSLSIALVFGLIAFIASLALIFLSVAVAFILSKHVGGFAGFAIVAGFYLLVTLVLISIRRRLTGKLEQKIKLNLKKKN